MSYFSNILSQSLIKAQDVDEVLSFIHSSQNKISSFTTITSQQWTSLIENGNVYFYYKGKDILGCIYMIWSYIDKNDSIDETECIYYLCGARIVALYCIDEEIGKEIVNELYKQIQEQGMNKLQAHCLFEDTKMLKYYISLGFKHTDHCADHFHKILLEYRGGEDYEMSNMSL